MYRDAMIRIVSQKIDLMVDLGLAWNLSRGGRKSIKNIEHVEFRDLDS
jgi:hypothetical protein